MLNYQWTIHNLLILVNINLKYFTFILVTWSKAVTNIKHSNFFENILILQLY